MKLYKLSEFHPKWFIICYGSFGSSWRDWWSSENEIFFYSPTFAWQQSLSWIFRLSCSCILSVHDSAPYSCVGNINWYVIAHLYKKFGKTFILGFHLPAANCWPNKRLSRSQHKWAEHFNVFSAWWGYPTFEYKWQKPTPIDRSGERGYLRPDYFKAIVYSKEPKFRRFDTQSSITN